MIVDPKATELPIRQELDGLRLRAEHLQQQRQAIDAELQQIQQHVEKWSRHIAPDRDSADSELV